MKSRVVVMVLIVLFIVGPVSAQQRFIDYSQVTLLRWMGSEPPDTYTEYLATHPIRSLQIVPVRMAPLRMPLGAGPPRVLVIVNSTLLPFIQTNVDRYISDIQAAGYAADLYSSTQGSAEELKAFIISQSTDLVGCVLFGDLPCAWYEVRDDHDEYGYASFPCDLYLMDLDGTWEDLETAYPMENGVYDTHTNGSGDTAPEIFLGRIDASQMSGDAEYVQINDYLDKLHVWYSSQMQMTNYALTYTEDDWSESPYFWTDIADAYPNNEAIKAPDTDREDYRDNRLASPVYQFIQLSCHSDPHAHYFTRGGLLVSSEIKAIPPRALFYNLFCCSASRYTYSDFLGGAYIFNPSATALATIGSTKTGSMLNFWAFYQPLGEGKTLGQAFSDWFNAIAPYSLTEVYWHYGMTIIGDPLVVPVSSDPSNIVLIQPNGGEELPGGEEYEIKWWTPSVKPDSISILLSVDSGETYPYTVASGLPGTDTTYVWTVDDFPVSLSRIKVEAWFGDVVEGYDISDSDFIIQGGPYRYVSPTGGNIFPYSAPTWAAQSIQDAVDAASPGDSIMVSEATYSENVSVTTPVYIYGGWNGDFTVRDPETYESRIQRTGTNVSFMNLGAEFCGIEGFTFASGTGTSTVLPMSGVFGGGVFSYNSSPLIKNNTFINSGLSSTTTFSAGGAIACYNGDVVIEGNEMTACKAQSGGGIYVYQATAEIRNNVISGSYANAIYTGNRRGGGLYAYHADVTLEDNVISGCYDYKNGGGIYSTFSQTSLSGDSIYANTALSYGGGLYAERDSIVISHAVIMDNTSGTFAGGIYMKAEYLEMTNSIVALNTAMLGGGFYPDSVSGVIVNNTFDRNEAAATGGNLYITNPVALDVRNNIISYGAQNGIYIPNLTGMTVGYNNAFGNTPADYLGTAPDTTNISLHPQYADTASLDYHLAMHSGSIDAGDPASEYNDPDGSRNDQGAFGGPAGIMAALEYVKNAAAAETDASTIRVTWDEIIDPTLAYYVIYGDTTDSFIPDAVSMLGTVPGGTEYFDHTPIDGCWNYQVSAVDTYGYSGGFSTLADACTDPATGEYEPIVPSYVNRLDQNYPNPFNGTTTIRYSLEGKSDVNIRIYDTAGRLIKILEQKTKDPGRYETVWHGNDDAGRAVASGVYFCRITTGSFSQTRKIVYLR